MSNTNASYWTEFRTERRALLATALGMGTGFSAANIVTSIMAPHFIADLHWSPAAFAKVGAVSILLSVFIPIAGRLADVWGPRRTAMIGVVALPLCMIALSRMNGPIWQYYLLFTIQAILCVTTTATVFSRVVVAHFRRARGLALAIAASAPGVTGIFAGAFLNPFVEAHGWRAGYMLTATIAFTCGCIALLLIPRQPTRSERPIEGENVPASSRRRSADYAIIFRARAFWILIVAMVLCNFYQTLVLAQINLVILSKGIDKLAVGGIIAAFSIAMVVGRFLCGAAIDRLPGHIVASIGMGIPALGLFLLASSLSSVASVTVAMILIGVAVGAEGDLIGVLVARAFGVAIYSSVMGLVTGAISLATASGALVLSIVLARYQGYEVFLWLAGAAVLTGSLVLLLLPKTTAPPDSIAPATPLPAAAE